MPDPEPDDRPRPTTTISVIIPTLNEAGSLGRAVWSVRERAERGGPIEVIVSDCGSTDGTAEVARGLGVLVVPGEPPATSRAEAINRAAEVASGEVFWVLDADTLAPPGYDRLILRALEDRRVVGGAFEFRLGGAGWKLRVVELINRVRYRVRGRFYGDQGIFCRADAHRAVGGYPPIRLMEAAHFCKALRRVGRLKLVRVPIETSARRFLDGGVFRVLATDARIWWLDLLGLPVERLAGRYREDNQRRGRAAGRP